MKILIAYGTTEGQTKKIAETLTSKIEGMGHDVFLFDTSSKQEDLDLENFDKIILGGSVHQKDYQEALKLFISANRDLLSKKPTLFISVSLASAFEDRQEEAKDYVSSLSERLNWIPTDILLVAGAIRYDEYDYFKEQIIKHIVLRGQTVEVQQGEHEFTDWSDLSKNVTTFVAAE
ncbi:MAG: flavodoxin domain-containing protein [bacterium]